MKAKYNATGNYLEEQLPPELDPAIHDANAHPELYEKYKAVLASLRTIPCHPSCVGKWSDGQELTEGKDYELHSFCDFKNEGCRKAKECPNCRFGAVPLPVKSEDEMERLKAENEKMRKALEVIANWQLPPTGKVWDNDNAQPISFEAEYGSNGARDYMKQVATEALKNNTHG